ncbi:Crp/Fnr family transcriptional regulator [Sphingomonas sp. NFX23]|uniref:Crp/Fnr family transcriptional regulator n=1 Tax=Sphingomonas sp. NFX23 TaxID=2819532 RepID=UPI003CF97AF9
MINILSPFVDQLGSYAPLNESDKAAIFSLPVSVRTFDRETQVARQGDIDSSFLVLVEGFATRQKLTGNGRRQLLSLDLPGDPLNLSVLFLSSADYGVLALANAKIAFVPRQPVIELLNAHASIMHAFFKSALVDASITREAVLNHGQRDALARLAHFLCQYVARMEARDLTSQGEFKLPFSQGQLGDATGLTAVHVNRMLSRLVDAGLITHKGRSFKILNVAALKRAGDFKDEYLFLKKPA